MNNLGNRKNYQRAATSMKNGVSAVFNITFNEKKTS
jgi:hypothetical protein